MPVHFWRQAGYYFSLYAVLGLVSPYLGYWLSEVMGSSGMRYALATFYATMIFVPALWGHVAFVPRNGFSAPGHWLSFGTLGAALFALGLTQISPQLPILTACFLVLAFGVFFNALVALLESISYQLLGSPSKFSQIRVFGSLGFMACSVVIGGTMVMSYPWTFPYLISAIMTIAWIQSLAYKTISLPSEDRKKSSSIPLSHSFAKLWPVWGLVASTQAAFACYFAFFALRMKEIGFSGPMIGVLIGLATAAEVFTFLKMGSFMSRHSPRTLILWSTALTSLRWVVLWMVASYSWVAFLVVALVQLTQSFGFSIFHVSTIRTLHESVPSGHFGTLRGLSEAFGFGVGGVLGVFLAGTIWEAGHHAEVFLVASGLAFISFLFALFLPRLDK